jgi:hypothetical protein
MSTNASSRFSSRKRVVALVASAVLVFGGGAAAFAYWTATGTGTGEATTGESTDFAVTSLPATGPAMTPGGTGHSVTFEIANDGTSAQTLTSVSVAIMEDDGTVWNDVVGCSAADYTLGTPVVTPGPIAAGDEVTGTVTITMVNDEDRNQDGCQLAEVPLYISAS